MKVLDRAVACLETLNNLASYSKNGPFSAVSIDFHYPKLKVDATSEIKIEEQQSGKETDVYLERKLSTLNFDPLFGAAITVDVLDVMMTAMPALQKAVGAALEEGVKARADFKKGKNKAYAYAEVKLIFDAVLNLSCELFTTREKGYDKWNYKPSGEATSVVTITLQALVEAAFKYWIVEGVLELGAKIIAKGSATVRKNEESGKVELVFYHDGIRVIAWVSSKFSIDTDEKDEGDSTSAGSRVIKKVEEVAVKKVEEVGDKRKEVEWVIADKLDVDKSNFNIEVF